MALDVLTRRQLEVLTLLAHGYTQPEIAVYLGLGLQTIKTHVHTMLRRLGARNVPHATMMIGRDNVMFDTPPVLPRRRTHPRRPGAVTDPTQRAYLEALDRYLASGATDAEARIDMLIALTDLRERTT